MDLGCYCLHMMRAITGSEPKIVSADALEGPPGIDLAMYASLRFGNDLHAILECSMVGETSWPSSMRVRARGARGRLEVLNPMAPQLGHLIRAWFDDGTTIEETIDTTSSYEHQLRAFRDVVAGAREPLTGGTDSVANMLGIDAIYQASGLGPRR